METVYCGPHLVRTGRKVKASHMVNDEPFCEACFQGASPGKRKWTRYGAKGVDASRVVALRREGLTALAIAKELGVTKFTVYYHLKHAADKDSVSGELCNAKIASKEESHADEPRLEG